MQVIALAIPGVWLIAGFLYRRHLRRSTVLANAPRGRPRMGAVVARASQSSLTARSPLGAAADPLTVMRLIFLGLVIALILFVAAFSFNTPWNSEGEEPALGQSWAQGCCP